MLPKGSSDSCDEYKGIFKLKNTPIIEVSFTNQLITTNSNLKVSLFFGGFYKSIE